MKNKALLASSAALVLLSAFMFAPVRQVAASVAYSGMAIISSTIDSTVIGASFPATGHFLGVTSTGVTATNAEVNGAVPGLLTSQGGWFGWNKAGLGETDLLTHPGSGAGGFNWYNGAIPSLIMSLDQTGNLSGSKLTFGNALINGDDSWVGTGTFGLSLAYNQSGSLGESDFINQQVGSTGGFQWYNTTSHALFPPIMNLTGAGVLGVPGGIVANLSGNVNGNLTGNVTGSLSGNVSGNVSGSSGSTTGNANTATQFAASPSPCNGTNSYTNGVGASGNSLNCSATVLWASTNSVCTTTSGSGCTGTLTWDSPGFSGGAPSRFICQGDSPSGFPQGPYVTGMTGSTITYSINPGTASQGTPSSFGQVMCWGRQ